MPAITPFSDEDFDTLGNWLERRAKGISDIVELEGFLTAIVIGPNTLSPLAWLPKVWGGKQPSGFKDLDELNRFVALVMGFYNSIVADFEATPSKFVPTFYESKEKGKKVFIVDELVLGIHQRHAYGCNWMDALEARKAGPLETHQAFRNTGRLARVRSRR